MNYKDAPPIALPLPLLETLLSNIEGQTILYRKDMDRGAYDYISPGVSELFGYPPEVWFETPDLLHNIIHPDSKEDFEQQYKALLEGAALPSFEYQVLCKDGSLRRISEHSFTQKNAQGTVIAISGIITDITRESDQSAFDLVWEVDVDGRYTHVTPRTKDILGYSPEEMIGHTPSEFMSETEARRIKTACAGHIDEHTPYKHLRAVYLHKNGKHVHLETSAVPIFGTDGMFYGYRGISRDISEQIHYEQSLKQREHELSAIIEAIPLSIFVKDAKELRYVRMNKATEELVGHSREEMIGKNDYDFFTKEQADFFIANDRKVLMSGLIHDIPEEPIQSSSGTRILHTQKVAITDAKGNPKFLLGISEDITERNKAKERLQKSEQLLATSQHIARLGSWEMDFSTKHLTWSDEVYRIFAIDPEAFDNSYEAFLNLIHPDDKEDVHNAFSRSVNEGIPYNIEHRLLMADGTVRYVHERGETVYENGQPVRSIGTVQDITEIQELHEQIREKDRILHNQAKNIQMGEMLNMIAHQWRQPLNALSASAIRLMMKQELGELPDEEITEHSRFVQEQTQLMSKTINDFMNFFKPDQAKQHFTLPDLIQEVVSLMGAQLTNRGIVLRYERDAAVLLHTYKNELSHVLLNLIANARDAYETAPGTVARDIEISISEAGDAITVKDHAGGIPEEVIDKIFNPYFTTKEQGKGTGIGLYMTKRIVEEVLEGEIVACNEGDGVRFDIRLFHSDSQ